MTSCQHFKWNTTPWRYEQWRYSPRIFV